MIAHANLVFLLVLAAGAAFGGEPGVSAAKEPRAAADFSAQLDTRWDFGKPEVSESRFRKAMTQYAANSREALEITTQIARALSLQRKFDQAHAVLDTVEPRLAGVDSRVRVRYLLERGRTFNSSGLPDKAVPLFVEAADVAAAGRSPGTSYYRVDALHMLGIAAPEAERLDWNRKALAVAEAASDARARGWRGSLYHNIGWGHFDRGDPVTALEYWRKALAVREAAKDVPRTRVAKWTVARGLRALGQLDEAETIQRALADEFQQAQEPDGYVFEELAEIEMARGRRAKAAPWAAKAFAILRDDPWFVATEPARLKRLAEIGSGEPSK